MITCTHYTVSHKTISSKRTLCSSYSWLLPTYLHLLKAVDCFTIFIVLPFSKCCVHHWHHTVWSPFKLASFTYHESHTFFFIHHIFQIKSYVIFVTSHHLFVSRKKRKRKQFKKSYYVVLFIDCRPVNTA